jgi:hypothetical protein
VNWRQWWGQGVNLLLGLWLMVAPAALGYAGTTAGDHHRFVGPLVAAFAFLALSAILRGLRWLNLPAGAWLVVAPFLVGFDLLATLVSVLTGVAIVGLAPVGRPTPERFGGGWTSLWRSERLGG